MNFFQRAQFFSRVWEIIPGDCKRSMTSLSKDGRLGAAKAEIMADAEKQLRKMGKFSELDCCWALELAAERWIAAHPKGGVK